MTPRELLMLVVLVAFLPGCGYRVASQNRIESGARKLVIQPLENRSTTQGVEQILTRALIRQFVQSSSMQIVNRESEAELILAGAVNRVSASPVTFGRTALGSTFLVTVQVSVSVTEKRTGKSVFANPAFVFQERYVINAEVENFFSELNPALERVADDFASSVVTTMREDF